MIIYISMQTQVFTYVEKHQDPDSPTQAISRA